MIEGIAFIVLFFWISISIVFYIGDYITCDAEVREYAIINKYLKMNGDYRKIEDIESKAYSMHLSVKQYIMMKLTAYKFAGKILHILFNILTVIETQKVTLFFCCLFTF